MNATAGSADGVQTIIDRLGITTGDIVMEIGFDSDIDASLREAVVSCVGELHDEGTDEVVDTVLLWWRDDDGDLVDVLMDARTPMADDGVVWLLTPKPGRDGHIESADIAEAAPTAGLQGTSSLNAGTDWVATRLVAPRGR
ncbi:DUF3052 family protein [Stackebrandtia endophytica]|uniref:DUF3052 family protein n=1 Tax=Stackebrandtia endophytica TaxID=1496996 RepID=A0A543ARB8_9ACTN|nr:DUF3052 domain-containing protein [Stackebrandtia endophytica]TQL75114.1 DUF3052 family protein [Stackebrandtia endophytica]